MVALAMVAAMVVTAGLAGLAAAAAAAATTRRLVGPVVAVGRLVGAVTAATRDRGVPAARPEQIPPDIPEAMVPAA